MPTQAPPQGVQLPPGWTYHELNGRAFYYHAATNVTRQDMPSTVPNDMLPMYPAALAPQMPLFQPQEQAQPQVEPEPPQPQAVLQAFAVPQAMNYSMATPTSSPRQAQQMLAEPLIASPQETKLVAEERRIDPLLGGQTVSFGEFIQAHDSQGFDHAQLAAIWAQLYPAVQAQPQPPPATSNQQHQLMSPQPAQALLAAQPVTLPAATQEMKQLRVFVPEPGLRAGQQLAFTAPDAGPGRQPMQMRVTVNEQVMPGSIVTVQYPRPHAPQVQSGGQNLPQPAVQVSADEDQRQSNFLWALYGLGFVCCFFIPLATIALWLGALGLHYCKPEHHRAQYPRARVPAKATAITCLACMVLGMCIMPLGLYESDIDWSDLGFDSGHQSAAKGQHSHRGPWHHGQPGFHHKGPCPFGKMFGGNLRGSHHGGEEWGNTPAWNTAEKSLVADWLKHDDADKEDARNTQLAKDIYKKNIKEEIVMNMEDLRARLRERTSVHV